MTPTVVDLFAGPGGWSEGLACLGLVEVGVDNDAAACATAEAAGHARVMGDIHAMSTGLGEGMDGLIASPPCPGFSAAGKGLGRQDFDMLVTRIDEMASGRNPAHVIDHARSVQHDPRSALTLEPLRWILDTEPRWVALEQVPTVLPLWQACAKVLALDGYSVWTGLLHAEQYGVPQTRKRAVLMASRDGVVAPPAPTHSRYYPRNPTRLDRGVLPWVSMAEALGWGMTGRPYFTVATAGGLRGGADEQVGGSGARRALYGEREAGRWQPVPALEGDAAEGITWPEDRPSPTIVGSYHPEVVAAPGYRKAGDPPRQRTPGSVRITVPEAAVLQSFRAGYPWQGSRTKQFQQVGNAVPPLLAAHVTAALTGLAVQAGAA